ncbi:MAG: rhomboid family intramembrane serine protease [Myxococcota bacterium]
MDTGYVLAWMVGLSSGLALLLSFTRKGRQPRGWIVVHSAVLSILAIGCLSVSVEFGGQLAGAIWAPTVLVPVVLARQIPQWLADRRFSRARFAAHVIRWMHPADDWQFQVHIVAGLEALDRGDIEAADGHIHALPPGHAARVSLTAQRFRATGDYVSARDWLERQERSHPKTFNTPSVIALDVRVAGELGDFSRLMSRLSHGLKSATTRTERASYALIASAFSGDVDFTHELLLRALPDLPEDAKTFWRATVAQRSGRAAHDELAALEHSPHPVTKAAGRRRREHPLEVASEDETEKLAPFLASMRGELENGSLQPPKRSGSVATWALTAVLSAGMLAEIPGGVEDIENLMELGALVVPYSLFPNEWWRVITAGLLHYGWLHFTLNVVALVYFGRQVERHYSGLWLTAIFSMSSIGAMSLILITSQATPDSPGIVIGASGGVMGVLGAMLASVALTYFYHRPPRLRRRLIMLLTIIALQVVFDAVTPQVSGPVHVYGLVIGTLLGAWASWRAGVATARNPLYV